MKGLREYDEKSLGGDQALVEHVVRSRRHHVADDFGPDGRRGARIAVRADVLGQVVGAHEPLAAVLALEPLLARVRPSVALQFVGAREAFRAHVPVAAERLVAGVAAQVGPEMRRLAVGLVADVADVQAGSLAVSKDTRG